jgi:hypothetical protein
VLIDLCHRRPTVALAILRTLARRVRNFASIVSDLAFRPVDERLARYLTTAVAEPIKRGSSIDVTVTQSQLAARLGTVRELVARAFSPLERTDVISRDRSRVMVRDPARLAALARGDDALRGHTGVTQVIDSAGPASPYWCMRVSDRRAEAMSTETRSRRAALGQLAARGTIVLAFVVAFEVLIMIVPSHCSSTLSSIPSS